MLPVHIVIGNNEYTLAKTETAPRIGKLRQPVAEKTKFGWTIMFPGAKFDVSSMLMTQTSATDYESLCQLDVLGLEDTLTGDQFEEHLTRSAEGWYETSLQCGGKHENLPNKKSGRLRRLDTLVKKLEKSNVLEQYDNVIKDQLNQGIMERVETPPQGREFYLPHKAVIGETAASTKLRVVQAKKSSCCRNIVNNVVARVQHNITASCSTGVDNLLPMLRQHDDFCACSL